MPRAIIIAGPNGAGKTTLAREYLPNEGGVIQFVNADLIAAGISPFDPSSADMAAGRAMLRRIEELVALRQDFAVETTLSGKWLFRAIRQWREAGYFVQLCFMKVPSAEVAIERIRNRVKQGGHFVPDEIVRRRYLRSTKLLDEYRNLVDRCVVFDNSGVKLVLVESTDNRG